MKRALDLCCGAGGASMGLHRAGYDVTGLDLHPQPEYPFRFVRADVLAPPFCLEDFDLIWASPPCQKYIRSGVVNKERAVDLLPDVRAMLEKCETPWIIENVPGAPMRPDYILCGSHFGLEVRRHRWFETSWHGFEMLPPCDHSMPATGVYGVPHGAGGAWPGMLPGDLETWSRAMGIDWMSVKLLSQAIPPVYSEFIARRVPCNETKESSDAR